MNMRFNILCTGLAFAAILSIGGCKKDDDTTTKPSLTGLRLESTVPYVAAGDNITFKAIVSGLTTSDSTTPETIGMFWQVNSGQRDTTTRDIKNNVLSYTIEFSEAQSYTVTCYVYADNYYNGSVSANVEAIDPETALSGLEGDPDVVAGGNPYRSITSGGLCWMAQNLYGTESGTVLLKSEVVAPLFGRYYTWNEAVEACPDGWRLPTPEEFDSLLGTSAGDAMADAQFLKKDMWPYRTEVKITNSSSFNAIPAGYQDQTSESYADQGFGEYACWWTSSQADGLAEYRYIYLENPVIQKGKGSISSLALSVRCVKEI